MKKTLKENNTKKVNRDMNLSEVVINYPDSAEVLLDYGLHCVGCIANSFDTVYMGAKVHGMTDEEIDEMIERINEVIAFNE
jgi:hybrid cluster-associated redox disulfide protein